MKEYLTEIFPLAVISRFFWFAVALFLAYQMLHHTQRRLFGKNGKFTSEVWDRIKQDNMAVAVFFSTQYAAALIAAALLARP